MNITANEVYTFKLNSGEELVAKVLQVYDNSLQIEEPVSIAPSPQGMGLVPSLFTADPKGIIMLNTSSISVYGMTDEPVKRKYIEATTGITVPSKKLVLG